MSKADKKQRQKAKRDAKKRDARRRDSISPVKRLAEARGELQCWLSDNFDERDQMQIFVHKRGAGLAGMAAFLIDRGVAGLKDAWTRMPVDQDEFTDMIEGYQDRGFPMRRAELEEAQRWVAGAARWAHDNGMRLPKDWIKTALLIGGPGDWEHADVSAFTKEFAGHPEDLRQRLIGEPLESYLRRKDISFIFNENAPFQKSGNAAGGGLFDLDEDELEEIADELPLEEINQIIERFRPAATALAAQTSGWLAERHEEPSPELFEAWRSVMMATMLSKAVMPEENNEFEDFGYELLEDLSGRIEPSRQVEYDLAVGQVLKHLAINTSMMQNAVVEHGFGGEVERLPED